MSIKESSSDSTGSGRTSLLEAFTNGFDFLPIGVALFSGQDFRLLKINRVFGLMLGELFDEPGWREHIIGQRLCDLGRPLNTIMWAVIFQRVSEMKEAEHEDGTLFIDATGREVYWNWTLEAIEGDQERVDYLLLTAEDVTERINRVRKEQAAERDYWLHIVESIASRIRGLFDIQQIGVHAVQGLVAHYHPQELYLYTNDTILQTFHLLSSHVPTGRRIRKRERDANVYKEASSMAYALHTRQPIIIEDIHRQHNDGMALSVLLKESNLENEWELRRYHSFILVPLWLGEQCIGVMTAFFSETWHPQGPEVRSFITCCRYIEVALANVHLFAEAIQERSQLRSVLDQLPEGVLFVEGTEGTLSYSNPAAAELLGFQLADLLNKPIHTFAYVDQKATALRMYNEDLFPWTFAVVRSLAGETIRSQQMFVSLPQRHDDRLLLNSANSDAEDDMHEREPVTTSVVLVSSAPIHDASHIITGAVVIFQDITAQKSLEQQKEDFLWMVNHELRTPITIIQGFAELLASDDGTSDEARHMQRDALRNILDQSNTLSDLIDDVFDVSIIERRTFMLQRARRDLVEMVARTAKNLAMISRRHHISFVFKTNTSETSVWAMVDEKRLVQALRNLIGNAIKYSPEGGEIEVGLEYVRERSRQVVLWVRDEGIGIPANDVERIFDRFQRGTTIDAAISGLGIGLFVVKEIVQQHGGTVRVESRLGQGTTFFITLSLQ